MISFVKYKLGLIQILLLKYHQTLAHKYIYLLKRIEIWQYHDLFDFIKTVYTLSLIKVEFFF